MKTFIQFIESYQSPDITDLTQRYLTGKLNADAYSKNVRSAFTTNKTNYDLLMKTQNTPEMKQWRAWYKGVVDKISEALTQKGYKWDSNPGWIGWDLPKQLSQKQANKTFKHYWGVELNQLKNFLPKLTLLATTLEKVPTQNKVSFKVPLTFSGFMTERDSLVIHFYDPQVSTQLKQTGDAFFQQNGITVVNRQQKYNQQAPDSGVDVNRQSDTEMLALRFLRNIDINKQAFLQLMQYYPDKFTQELNKLWTTLNQQGLHRL